ncbi:MAG: PAS domain S-box protein [Asgard group archaeon]|nr:PAS domain S-box protein [Asgard group archaeon]
MKQPLKILHLEDNKIDVELVHEILALENFEFDLISVDNREDFLNALKDGPIDIILADYSLPSFDGLTALKLTRELGLTTPFILVSAVLGEELAIEALQSGANDYVLKSRMERLIPAIKRALQEVEDRDQRLRLQKAIAELEDSYHKIAERVRGFLKMDLPEGKFSMVDNFLEELSGYSTQEWYETPNFILKIAHPDFKEYYSENFTKMQNGIVPNMLEYKIIRKDGEERWWLQFNIGAYDFNQKLISVSIVIIDDTENKESFLKYQNLFENALVGMYRTNIETGEIIDANETMARLFGCETVEEYMSYSAHEFYPDDNARKSFIDIINKEGFVQGLQLQLLKKGGEKIWVSLSAKIYLKEGYIEGVMLDISDKKKAEEELADRERELENIFEYTNSATLIVNEDMVITKCNQKTFELTGYSKEETEGKMKWTILCHPDDLSRMVEFHKMRRTPYGEQAPRNYQFRLINKNGEIVPVYLTVGLIPGTTNSVASAIDLSEEKKAEDALKRDRKVFKLIAEAAVQSTTIEDMCQIVLEGLVEVIEFDSGSISIYNDVEKTLNPMANIGLSDNIKQMLDNISIENKELPLTQFLGNIIFAPDIQENDFLKNTNIYKKYDYKSFISWPIYNANKKFLGSIQLGSKTKKAIPENDRLFFENLTGIFSTAIERKLADQALKESESQYRKLVESLPNSIGLMIIQDKEVKYASPTIFNMFQVESIKDIIGADPLNFFAKEYRETIKKQILENPTTEETIHFLDEVLLKRFSNDLFSAEIYVSATTFRGESALQILIWEITERKKAEEAIRISEQKYRSLVDTSPSMIALIDVSGKILFVNQYSFDIFGIDDEKELLNKNFQTIVDKKDKELVKTIFDSIIAQESLRNIELTFLRKDKRTFTGEMCASTLKDSSGNITSIIAIIQDISRRKLMEQQRRLLENIVENSKEVVISAKENGEIIYANAPTEDILGYKPEELVGKNITVLAPPGGEESQQQMFDNLKSTQKSTFETIRKHKDGSLIPVIITLSAIEDLETQSTTINAILVDISDLKELEESLKDRSYEFEVLSKVISAGYLARNMDELLDFTLSTVLNSLDYNGGAIYFVNKDKDLAYIKRSLGLSSQYVETAKTLPIKSSAFKKLFIDGKSIYAEDYMTRSEGHMQFGISSLIGVPFFSKQKVIGALMLSTKEKRALVKDDLYTLEAIGREIGTAIAKMQAEEELITSQMNLQMIFDTIDDLFIVFDCETGLILNSNLKMKEQIEYSSKELEKITFYDLLEDKQAKSFKKAINKILTGKLTQDSLLLKTKSGNTISHTFKFSTAKLSDYTAIIARSE